MVRDGTVDAYAPTHSHMKLTVREAALLLSVAESQVYRWVDEGTIPSSRVNQQPRISRAELLEWAMARRMPVSVELFAGDENGAKPPSFAGALRRGGIHHCPKAGTRDAAFRAAVETLPGLEEDDRELLFEMLLARESLGSSGIGEGIAIPHVRSPVVFPGTAGTIALCFLDVPLDINAPDGQPVETLFLLVSPTIETHLQLLSQISLALLDPGFKALVLRRASVEQIHAAAERVEATFRASPPVSPAGKGA
jgi:PTS system nitrogen regulatory IIA component